MVNYRLVNLLLINRKIMESKINHAFSWHLLDYQYSFRFHQDHSVSNIITALIHILLEVME